MPSDDLCEVRFNVPRAIFDVYDMRRMALRMSKQQMGALIFTEWARMEVHAAKLVLGKPRDKADDAQLDIDEQAD